MIVAGNGERDSFSCRVKSLRVSGMTRAKETADIIASYLPIDSRELVYHAPDHSLNEGRPCHHVPGVRATPKVIEVTDDNHKRIEEAFQTYFYRSPVPPVTAEADSNAPFASEATNHSPLVIASSSVSTAEKSRDTIDGPVNQTIEAPPPSPQEHHEFEIIVCHANVIRYFVCRYDDRIVFPFVLRVFVSTVI